MGKTGESRIGDVKAYLIRKGLTRLALHLMRKLEGVDQSDREQIGEDLSLGTREGTSDQRRALRSLLLCQRVYLSPIAYRPFMASGGREPKNLLVGEWKAQSLVHWENLTEAEIIAGIKAYAVLKWTSGREALAEKAIANERGGDVAPLKTSRNKPFPGNYKCCYSAVMSWLFVSGLVSYGWIANSESADKDAQLVEVFGLNDHTVVRSIWDGTKEFTLRRENELERPAAGYIVHVYNREQWRGHWLVSNGDGTFCGVNNDTEDGRREVGIKRLYDSRCSLAHQLLSFTDTAAGKYGVADVIDPLKIPKRMGS